MSFSCRLCPLESTDSAWEPVLENRYYYRRRMSMFTIKHTPKNDTSLEHLVAWFRNMSRKTMSNSLRFRWQLCVQNHINNLMFVHNRITQFCWWAVLSCKHHLNWHGNKLFDVVLRKMFSNLAKGCSMDVSYPLKVGLIVNIDWSDDGSNASFSYCSRVLSLVMGGENYFNTLSPPLSIQ